MVTGAAGKNERTAAAQLDGVENILVIGGASQDVLHLDGKSHQTVGGAGLYTALGARAAGVQAHMLAPFPNPMPKSLRPVTELINWFGPRVHPDELPHFEIVYDADGRAEYTSIEPRFESLMTESVLPDDLSAYTYVHIVQLGNIDLQLSLLDRCRNSRARFVSVSGGHELPEDQTGKLRELVARADLCFMNEHEAEPLLGQPQDYSWQPGTILFVTHGDRGLSVIQGSRVHRVHIGPTEAHDPTGAGDSFCGATLAYLCRLQHPVLAANNAVQVATLNVRHLGPKGLIGEAFGAKPMSSSRVEVNSDQTHNIARLLKAKKTTAPHTFTDMGQPTDGHPGALNFYFALTLQEFGFWDENNGRYQRPMVADIDGKTLKGSDFLLSAFYNVLGSDPGFFHIDRQANLSKEELGSALQDDHGICPVPALDLHLSEARAYGRDMLELGVTPNEILKQANESKKPLDEFLRFLWQIGGYKDDPLQKKSALLAYILVNRPERFLRPATGETLPPCIDYHLMRAALRTGIVSVADPGLRQQLIDRRRMSHADEYAIRSSVYEAIRMIADCSGVDMVSVDQFFFQMRRGCPEMSEPECERCILKTVCARNTHLFQPVIRTTYY
ncbi:MAG: carbohydrate kinase family protein [Anaerolineales bacterium]|nr:carbohydrate kinase family protein [Anaerolineales bacterium]HJN41972.1 carbohydrate kinase family protein [Anaerolineales bacterium]